MTATVNRIGNFKRDAAPVTGRGIFLYYWKLRRKSVPFYIFRPVRYERDSRGGVARSRQRSVECPDGHSAGYGKDILMAAKIGG